MVAVCWIFILQQIQLEKNDFHKLVDWNIGFHGAKFSKKLNYLVLNDADFCEATDFSGFDVKSNERQMAAVYRIFILQQIKFEKNGFHRVVELQIGF